VFRHGREHDGWASFFGANRSITGVVALRASADSNFAPANDSAASLDGIITQSRIGTNRQLKIEMLRRHAAFELRTKEPLNPSLIQTGEVA
jgi:hypothetical protein